MVYYIYKFIIILISCLRDSENYYNNLNFNPETLLVIVNQRVDWGIL